LKGQLADTVVTRGLIPQKASEDKHLSQGHLRLQTFWPEEICYHVKESLLQHPTEPLSQRIGEVSYVKVLSAGNQSGVVLCNGSGCPAAIFSSRASSSNSAARGCPDKDLDWEFDWEETAEFLHRNCQKDRNDQRRDGSAAHSNGLENLMWALYVWYL
jgi:hypothetical protein